MTDPNSKAGLGERVKALRINPDAIEEVRVHVPGQEKGQETLFVIPNADGKRMSLQIWANATNRSGYADSSSGSNGLTVYGNHYVSEAQAKPGEHPAIDPMIALSRSKERWRVDVIRRNSFKQIPEHVRKVIADLIEQDRYETFYVYDRQGIRDTAIDFNQSFGWTNFTNFFAVKALPDPFILEGLNPLGFGLDCSSLPELTLGEATGFKGERKIYTSNNTHPREFVRARSLGAIINLDDITFIEKLKRATGSLPDTLCFRYNQGALREGSEIIGNPEDAKFGIPNDQIVEAYRIAKSMGVKRFGLHTMIVSNMLREEHLIETGRMLFDLEARIHRDVGIPFDFIDVGGGVGIPYRPEQIKVDLHKVAEGMKTAYREAGLGKNGNCPRLVMECGRAIAGPHGLLVSKVINIMRKYRNFIGLDTSINNLLRAGIYSGSYHHATVFGKENDPQTRVYTLVGSLCEGNDVLGENRTLPEVSEGNRVVFHDAGAHGSAMRNEYNGRLNCAGFGVNPDGTYEMTERPGTEQDYFATRAFPGSRYAHLAAH